MKTEQDLAVDKTDLNDRSMSLWSIEEKPEEIGEFTPERSTPLQFELHV